MVKTLVITSGGFDPLHAGHISAFERMSEVGHLKIIVNNDEWLKRKKEKYLLDEHTRFAILDKLGPVEQCYLQTSKVDDHVIFDLAWIVKAYYKRGYDRIVFAKSGDRTHENSPEYEWCLANGVEWLEVESDYPEMHSSKILSDWQNAPVERGWGHYLTTVPYQVGNLKFKPKVLVVKRGQSLSLQSHKHRKEVWYVVDGYGHALYDGFYTQIYSGNIIDVEANSKHKLWNNGEKDLVILEWQVGERVDESDIIRYST